jgi:hypothetical protein
MNTIIWFVVGGVIGWLASKAGAARYREFSRVTAQLVVLTNERRLHEQHDRAAGGDAV